MYSFLKAFLVMMKLQVICSCGKLQKPLPNVISSEKHSSTAAIRLKKEIKSMPNTAQTRLLNKMLVY